LDRVIYIAMTGAREITRQQAAVAHNLANVSTHGFKQELSVFRALPVVGEGARTRAFVVETTPRTDHSQGVIQHSERSLDVAIHGQGWLAVQDARGREAYTRAGQLEVSQNGVLQTSTGLNILDDSGAPISVPTDQEVAIAKDGTVSTIPIGQNLNAVSIAGRLKLVNPPEREMVKGEDGLFRQKSGQPALADANIQVVSGALETSNVNPAEALVNMISLGRQFETQMRVLRSAEDNHKSGDKILALR
jgi:flagellar basal-body rod protein FlgF